MVDELFDREYRAGRAGLNKGIEALVIRLHDAIAPVFTAIHRIDGTRPGTRPQTKTQN